MIFLTKPYKPLHKENRMKSEGDIESARQYFFSGQNRNLRFLLENRYGWMNRYIKPLERGVEVGCGIGATKEFIKTPFLLLTDFANYDWLDVKRVDAVATAFKDSEFDFVIASNMIHHIAVPKKFFQEMRRILKPGGLLLIQDINASFFMRLILRLMRHEGYNFGVNVFDENAVCTDEHDLWAGNDAIVNLLFDDQKKFERNLPFFKTVHTGFSEFLLFLNSGGVVAKTFYIPLPHPILKIVQMVDATLAKFFPSIFALQRQIVLQKIS